MSEAVKKINRFFKNAVRTDIDDLSYKLLLTNRQQAVFNMYYVEDRDINYIADNLCVCGIVVAKDLKIIRNKISKVLGYI